MQCDAPEISVEDFVAKKGGEYVAEPKFDGFRLVAHLTRECVEFYTREGKRQDGKLPHVEFALMQMWPLGTILDGEIVALTQDDEGHVSNNFELVQSVMLSKPERARERIVELRAQGTPITYMVFDCLQNQDMDLRECSLKFRKGVLDTTWVLQEPDEMVLALAPLFPAKDYVLEACVEKGFEGIVIKDFDSVYASGSRGKGWYKFKPQTTVDVVVLGFTPGDGKYKDTVGAIIFGQPAPDEMVHEVLPEYAHMGCIVRGQCSGMTDAFRYALSPNDIGRTMEIKHHGLMHGGVKFRHPQFNRWRDDKPANQVHWHDKG